MHVHPHDDDCEDWKAAVAAVQQKWKPSLSLSFDFVHGMDDDWPATALPVCTLGEMCDVLKRAAGLPRGTSRLKLPDDYPRFPGVDRFLRRAVRLLPLTEARKLRQRVFVKPAFVPKAFTGQVMVPAAQLSSVVPPELTHVWVSSVVDIVAEYRVFVVGGLVLAHTRYASTAPQRRGKHYDPYVPQEFAVEYADSGDAPAAYVADFGVTRQGETLLVEVNDGYCFGTYGVAVPALAVAAVRWKDLVKSAQLGELPHVTPGRTRRCPAPCPEAS